MRKKERAESVVERLAELYPGAECELDYRNAWELLVATVLSAQCTDQRVNQVTPVLFGRWPDPEALAGARLEEIEEIILKALAPEIPDRYQQVGGLLDDLVTAGEIDHRASRMENIRMRLKAREPTPAGFCWNCRKPLHARAQTCPFCGEKQ